MSTSYTHTGNTTFTLVHARHLAAKVATDLKRMGRFYGEPRDGHISELETEATILLKEGYLGIVYYGFRRHRSWIEPTLRYTAQELDGRPSNDDSPGKIRANADVQGASFSSYLIYSSAWHLLPAAEQEAIYDPLSFRREGAPEPGVAGYFLDDKTYSAGGRAIDRASVRSFL